MTCSTEFREDSVENVADTHRTGQIEVPECRHQEMRRGPALRAFREDHACHQGNHLQVIRFRAYNSYHSGNQQQEKHQSSQRGEYPPLDRLAFDRNHTNSEARLPPESVEIINKNNRIKQLEGNISQLEGNIAKLKEDVKNNPENQQLKQQIEQKTKEVETAKQVAEKTRKEKNRNRGKPMGTDYLLRRRRRPLWIRKQHGPRRRKRKQEKRRQQKRRKT